MGSLGSKTRLGDEPRTFRLQDSVLLEVRGRRISPQLKVPRVAPATDKVVGSPGLAKYGAGTPREHGTVEIRRKRRMVKKEMKSDGFGSYDLRSEDTRTSRLEVNGDGEGVDGTVTPDRPAGPNVGVKTTSK
jgi:hypothetical protein